MTAGRINSSLNLRHAPSPQCNLPGLWLCPPSPKDWQISQPNSNCSWKQSCSVHCARPPTTRTRRLVHRHTPICSSAQVAAPSSRPWWWALHRHPQKESPDSVKLDHMAQNDALSPQGTVDASGWLHNMRGDAMSMPGFGHLSDSVIVHTGASAYSAPQNGGNSAPQASTPNAAMAATCPDPTYREIVRCPAPSHFLRPRADVHAHAEANNMETEIDKHAHDDMTKRPNKRSKNQQWQTVSIVTGWSAVNNALQLLANKDFPGGEWKPCRAHETKEFVDYHYMCPFGRMGHTCPVTCRVRIPRTSKGEMSVHVADRPVVHETTANIEVQLVQGQTHTAHSGAQGQQAAHKGAHLIWQQATKVNGYMLDWGTVQPPPDPEPGQRQAGPHGPE